MFGSYIDVTTIDSNLLHFPPLLYVGVMVGQMSSISWALYLGLTATRTRFLLVPAACGQTQIFYLPTIELLVGVVNVSPSRKIARYFIRTLLRTQFGTAFILLFVVLHKKQRPSSLPKDFIKNLVKQKPNGLNSLEAVPTRGGEREREQWEWYFRKFTSYSPKRSSPLPT